MKIGFTGTQIGLTERQLNSLEARLSTSYHVSWAIHGDCVGADAEFDQLCVSLGYQRGIYPSNIEAMRARCDLRGAIVMHAPAAPLRRNVWIVNAVDRMIACPKEGREILKSGTWSTVRHAWKVGKPVDVIYPDGRIQYDARRAA